MRSRSGLAVLLVAVTGIGFGQRYRYDDDDVPMPAGANEKTEWVFGRLRYPSGGGRRWGGGSWATDYPKADRQFVQGVRRLTRLHTRPVEQVVDIDSDEIYNTPWLYAVEVGYWELNPRQAARLREYLQRGGFLMTDDFHGTDQWMAFHETLRTVFPDRMVVDIEKDHQIFHVMHDLDERFQVPGIQMFRSGRTWERDGVDPAWRAIVDDKGRVMMAICHNMDLGDAWEWADIPQYPEHYASLAYRVGMNYILYAMTH
jgi:hypothetical protein